MGKRKDCGHPITSFQSCGRCNACIESAKRSVRYIHGKYRDVEVSQISRRELIIYEIAQAIILANLTPMEVDKFKASVVNQGVQHETKPPYG